VDDQERTATYVEKSLRLSSPATVDAEERSAVTFTTQGTRVRLPHDMEPGWLGRQEQASGDGSDAHRVVHLVLLDGRLVESWSEPVRGTPWEHLAESRSRPVVQLGRDEDQRLLDWLAALCGSRAALDALTGDDLETLPAGRPGAVPPSQRAPAPVEVDDHLDRLRGSCFDDESLVAMRRAASSLGSGSATWSPELTSLQRAAGVAWVVAKANGLFGQGRTTPGAVQHALGITSTITAAGRAVERALVGPLAYVPARPVSAPDLLALGRPDLLLGATRRAIIGWRDAALTAQAAVAARHPCTACSPS
jgi:hypothetical protein